MADPIPPPAARGPAEALQLVSIAVSDGDLEAALAQYEDGAALRPWADQAAWHGVTMRRMLVSLMQLRLPLALQVRVVLQCDAEVALVLGGRRIAGRGPDGERIDLSGDGATVVRRQRDGCWRIAVDAWQLDGRN